MFTLWHSHTGLLTGRVLNIEFENSEEQLRLVSALLIARKSVKSVETIKIIDQLLKELGKDENH